MTHIDEGTIHAWLDDALPPDEAVRVEAHLRDCAECSAAVAEARGFIAASSRILSALDDVPGKVIPHAGGDAAGVKPEVVKRGATPARRRWWQRPQFAAAAGIAFIAAALSVVARRDGVRSVTDSSAERTPAGEAQRAPSNEAQRATAPGALGAPAAAPPSSIVAPQGVSAERRAVVAAPAPAPAARESTVTDTAVRGVATAPGAPGAAVAGGIARPADSTVAKRTLTLSPDAITRTEKARLAGERNVQQGVVAATGVAEAQDAARRDATTLQGIVGCYRLQRRVPALDAGVTEIIALEGTETGSHDGEVLRLARLIGAQPQANTQWHWTLSPTGDVALVRQQAGTYARFPLALRLAAQTEEMSIATRVDCPTR